MVEVLGWKLGKEGGFSLHGKENKLFQFLKPDD